MNQSKKDHPISVTHTSLNRHHIDIKCKLSRYHIKTSRLKKLISILLDHLRLGPCEISLEFVGPRRMRTLNQTFRGKDSSTDVLSFPQNNWQKPLLFGASSQKNHQRRYLQDPWMASQLLMLGDLAVSLDDATRNAKKIGQGLDREVAFLIVHGLLHLCGHDHMNPKEERVMLKEQHKAMKILLERVSWHHVITKYP